MDLRSSTIVMIGFAVLFGLLAVFLAQTWLNNQADARLRSFANWEITRSERVLPESDAR